MAATDSDAGPSVSSDQTGRFSIAKGDLLQQCMQACSSSTNCSKELQELCSRYQDQSQVPWRVVVEVQKSAKCLPGHQDLTLQQLCSSSSLCFTAPPPRQRSAALQQRLQQLQRDLESKQYAAMVRDIKESEPSLNVSQEDMFPTTKLQLSFGLHVVVTMGTFFALFYYAAKWALHSDKWAAAAGAVGLSVGMLLETALLIIRANMPESLDRRYAHLLRDDYLEQQQQQQGRLSKQQQHQQTGDQQRTKRRSPDAAKLVGGALGKDVLDQQLQKKVQ